MRYQLENWKSLYEHERYFFDTLEEVDNFIHNKKCFDYRVWKLISNVTNPEWGVDEINLGYPM